MKTILLILTTIFTLSLHAQEVTKVTIQASGLTCSMCSNSINKALKTVDFVAKVVPNIQTSSFEITFKQGSTVDFDRLKKKVEDAGFFVSKFIAVVDFKNIQVKANQPIAVGEKTFQFVNIKDGELNGEKPVRILNKGFVSTKEYRKNPLVSAAGARIYYATI